VFTRVGVQFPLVLIDTFEPHEPPFIVSTRASDPKLN
jgi:hypothetical protein